MKYNNESKETITNKYSVNIVVWVPVGFCVILVVLVISAVCKWCIQRGKKKNNRKEEEEMRLITIPENSCDQSRCELCNSISRHVFCVNCRQFYCVFCSHYHVRRKNDHIIMPLTGFDMKRSIQHCKKCNIRKAQRICVKCKDLFCNSRECACVHSQNLFDMLAVDFGFYAPVSTKYNANPVDMQVQNTIKQLGEYKQVRICGISLHLDDKCTIVDSKNKNVTVFKGSEKLFSTSLKNEPKGMAKVDDSKIAITFPYEMRILIYRIYENTITLTQTIDTTDHGKPFSICCDASHFAIEIGEGEDGRVVILDDQGISRYEIKNSANFAPFTGNSIKLSLDMDKKRIFVSAIEKQVISCVNFQGYILWSMGFPSTGDLVFIRERGFYSEYILLSSEKDSTVYHVSADDGSSRTFFFYKETQKRCPQHIAYFNQLLAILIDDKTIEILKDDSQPTKNKVEKKIKKFIHLHFHLNSPSPLFEP